MIKRRLQIAEPERAPWGGISFCLLCCLYFVFSLAALGAKI